MEEIDKNKDILNSKEFLSQGMGLDDQYRAIKKWITKHYGKVFPKEFVPTQDFFFENFNQLGDASVLYMFYRNDWCKRNYDIPKWFHISGTEVPHFQDPFYPIPCSIQDPISLFSQLSWYWFGTGI